MQLYVYVVKNIEMMSQGAFYCLNSKLEGHRFSAVRKYSQLRPLDGHHPIHAQYNNALYRREIDNFRILARALSDYAL
jgi:hypothetical protein